MSPRYVRRAGVVERRVGSTVFLADDEGGDLFRLNETGTALWSFLARPRTPREAVAEFRAAFPDEPARRVAASVGSLILELRRQRLLEVVPAATARARRNR